MRIGIIGAGGIGGYYAALLARAGHDVHVLVRDPLVASLLNGGIEARTPDGDFHADVHAGSDPIALAEPFGGDDFVLVTVKAYSLPDAAPGLLAFAARGATMVPLLNGIDIADRMAALGVPRALILGGLTHVSAVRLAASSFERRSPFQRIVVGELAGGRSARAERIAAAFSGTGATAEVSPDMTLDLWRKFSFIVALSAACGLLRAPIGMVRASEEGRALLLGAIGEVFAVGRAVGVALSAEDEQRTIEAMERLPDPVKPSLLVDLEANRKTEVDILSGTVVQMAIRTGLRVPVHERAASALRIA